MKKSAVLLLILLLATLTGCTKPSVQNKVDNEVDNTRSEIIHLIETAQERAENSTVVDYTHGTEYSYPLYASDIYPFIGPLPFENPLNNEIEFLLGILSVVLDDIQNDSSFSEDTWRMILDADDETELEYKVFLNDEDLYIQYYYIDDFENVIGLDLQFLMTEVYFSFMTHSMKYDTNDDIYSQATMSSFIDTHNFTKQYYSVDTEGIEEIEVFHYDYYENEYYHTEVIKDDDEYLWEFLERYKLDEETYIGVTYDNVTLTETIQFNLYDGMELMMSVSTFLDNTKLSDTADIDFDFNLNYVFGWDKITSIDNDLYLYDSDNLYINLNDEYKITETPSYGVFLSNNSENSDPYTFNLEHIDYLYPPIYFFDCMEMQWEAQDNANRLLEDIIYDDSLELNELIDNARIYLYDDEFHNLAQNVN